jgi:hypothetical protein
MNKDMATTTKTIKLKGVLKYHKLNEPDEFKGQKFWSINFYPDQASLATFQGLNLMNKIYEDEDGKWIRLKRPVEKRMRDEMVRFGPVVIVDTDNNVLSGPLGFGTEIEVDLTVYSSAMGSGSRLEKITVTKLVPYVPTAKEEAPKETPPSDLPF